MKVQKRRDRGTNEWKEDGKEGRKEGRKKRGWNEGTKI